MKQLLIVAILCVIAVSTYAQGAKVTVQGLSAKVEVQVPVDKAIKIAVNSGVLARTNSTITLINGTDTEEYIVQYSGGYLVTQKIDDVIISEFESTRVSDIRAMIIKWVSTE